MKKNLILQITSFTVVFSMGFSVLAGQLSSNRSTNRSAEEKSNSNRKYSDKKISKSFFAKDKDFEINEPQIKKILTAKLASIKSDKLTDSNSQNSENDSLENKLAKKCIDTDEKLKTLRNHVQNQALLVPDFSKKMLTADKKMDAIKSCINDFANQLLTDEIKSIITETFNLKSIFSNSEKYNIKFPSKYNRKEMHRLANEFGALNIGMHGEMHIGKKPQYKSLFKTESPSTSRNNPTVDSVNDPKSNSVSSTNAGAVSGG